MPDTSRLARLAAAGIAAGLITLASAAAASAHGAPQLPISRTLACGSAGQFQKTAACTAARAGSGGQWFGQWDNERVAGVNGRDRQTVPDGKLCSGGISGFGGLDLARTDWPSTRLVAGQSLTMSYKATIPHTGSFRVYLTKNGYRPTKPLRWADLEKTPFVTVKDPHFAGGAYSFRGQLPKGTVGHHVIYTVWQNTSTSDTYYSCSDVQLTKPAAAVVTKPSAPAKAAKPAKATKPKPKLTKLAKVKAKPATKATGTAEPSPDPAETTRDLNAQALDANTAGGGSGLQTSALAGTGLLVLALAVGGVFSIRRARRQS